MISYKLIRTTRKTVAIHITKDAVVEVRAPLRTPLADIDSFVASKQGWIIKHLKDVDSRVKARSDFTLDYGSMVMVFGEEHPIAGWRACVPNFRRHFNGDKVLVPYDLSPAEIKREVIRLYREIAGYVLPDTTERFAERMGVKPAGVKITSAKRRWGSCAGNNSLCFAWRLIMAGEDVVDYVVVHELAHIIQRDHSPRFWRVVEGVIPDYKDMRRKLRALQDRLAAENWDEY